MNSSRKIRVFHPNFDTVYAKDCTFFAILSKNSVFYTVFHNRWNRFLGVENLFFDKIEEFFVYWQSTHKNDIKEFKRHYIAYDTPYNSLLPKNMLDDEIAMNFLDIYHLSNKEYVPLKDYIRNNDSYNLYAIPRELHLSMLGDMGIDLNFWHISTLLYNERLFNTDALTHSNIIKISFLNSGFWILIEKNGIILFTQYFGIKDSKEIGYILMHLCHTYQVIVEQTEVIINGIFDEENDELMDILKGFLKLITLDSLPRAFDYEQGILNFPTHYFSLLFRLYVCVLLVDQ